jgi:translin
MLSTRWRQREKPRGFDVALIERHSAVESSLDSTTRDIQARFDRTNAVRDSALNGSRQVVRSCAGSIRALHRGEIEGAKAELAEAAALLNAIRVETASEPAVYWAGYVQDAMKEYAEASALLAIITGASLPDPSTLGVEDAPFLNGLAEAASELRRLILHTLREDDLEPAKRHLAAMNEIYDVLITVDFPDAITGGLRRTTDQLRAVLERTRGDVTLTLNQRRLEAAIRNFQGRIEPS